MSGLLNRDARWASAAAIPTALQMPCPSGPAGTSRPFMTVHSMTYGILSTNIPYETGGSMSTTRRERKALDSHVKIHNLSVKLGLHREHIC